MSEIENEKCAFQNWQKVLNVSQKNNNQTLIGQISNFCFELENIINNYILFPNFEIKMDNYYNQYNFNYNQCFYERNTNVEDFVKILLISRIKMLVRECVDIEVNTNKTCVKCQKCITNIENNMLKDIDIFVISNITLFKFEEIKFDIIEDNDDNLDLDMHEEVANLVNIDFVNTTLDRIKLTREYICKTDNVESYQCKYTSKGFFKYYIQIFEKLNSTYLNDYKNMDKTIRKLECLIPIYYHLFVNIDKALLSTQVFNGFFENTNLNITLSTMSITKLYNLFLYKVKHDIDIYVSKQSASKNVFYYIKDNTFSPTDKKKPSILNEKTLNVSTENNYDILTISSGDKDDIKYKLDKKKGNIFTNTIPNPIVASFLGISNMLYNKQNVILMSFGYSGTGKTANLFKSNGDNRALISIVIERLQVILKINSITFGCKEFYPSLSKSNVKEYPNRTNFDLSKLDDTLQNIDLSRKEQRTIRATKNNPDSSRSFISFEFTFFFEDNSQATLYVVDLPGKENIESNLFFRNNLQTLFTKGLLKPFANISNSSINESDSYEIKGTFTSNHFFGSKNHSFGSTFTYNYNLESNNLVITRLSNKPYTERTVTYILNAESKLTLLARHQNQVELDNNNNNNNSFNNFLVQIVSLKNDIITNPVLKPDEQSKGASPDQIVDIVLDSYNLLAYTNSQSIYSAELSRNEQDFWKDRENTFEYFNIKDNVVLQNELIEFYEGKFINTNLFDVSKFLSNMSIHKSDKSDKSEFMNYIIDQKKNISNYINFFIISQWNHNQHLQTNFEANVAVVEADRRNLTKNDLIKYRNYLDDTQFKVFEDFKYIFIQC
jgi:hypothetical protein